MSKIDEKVVQLSAGGLDFGSPVGPVEETVGFGGIVRRFQDGHIYWHPDVMTSGACEVHGGILRRYLNWGGPGVNPQTGRRDLGFPKTDETMTLDGLYRMNRFEWGGIFGFNDGSVLHGKLMEHWDSVINSNQGVVPVSGYPIDDQQDLADGQLAFFERGCWWQGPSSNDAMLTFTVTAPLIGRPTTVNPDSATDVDLSIQIQCDAAFTTLTAISRSSHPLLFTEIWKGRLFLRPVTSSSRALPEIPLECVQTRKPGEEVFTPVMALKVQVSPGYILADRTLYDLVYRNPQTARSYTLSPHAIYAKKSWQDFGFVHATDIHASRRLDDIRTRLFDLAQQTPSARHLEVS